MTETATTPIGLKLERTYPHPLATLRNAWLDPNILGKWFAPGPMTCTVKRFEPSVGGNYKITMHGEDGDYTCFGTFQAITHDTIAMGFNWEGDSAMPEPTLLKVSFAPDGDGTKLTLEHTGFPSQEACENHEEGWTGCMENLQTAIN